MLENNKILANGVKYTVDKLCNNELYFSVMIGLIYCTLPLRDTNWARWSCWSLRASEDCGEISDQSIEKENSLANHSNHPTPIPYIILRLQFYIQLPNALEHSREWWGLLWNCVNGLLVNLELLALLLRALVIRYRLYFELNHAPEAPVCRPGL